MERAVLNAAVFTNLLLQTFTDDVKHLVDGIGRRSQVGLESLRGANEAHGVFVLRALPQIEVEPDILIHDNGVLADHHQSPLSTIFSIFAS